MKGTHIRIYNQPSVAKKGLSIVNVKLLHPIEISHSVVIYNTSVKKMHSYGTIQLFIRLAVVRNSYKIMYYYYKIIVMYMQGHILSCIYCTSIRTLSASYSCSHCT